MAGEYRIIPVAANWKIPFFIALTVHISVIGSTILAPKFLPKKAIFPEFVIVDLINVTAPTPPAPPPAPKVETNITTRKLKNITPVEDVPAVSDPVAAETVEPVKAISIKPLKRKKKKKIVNTKLAQQKRTAEGARERQKLELKRQQLLAEAKHQKALADAEQQAANEAVQALKQMLLADAAVNSSSTRTAPPPRTGSASSLVENQYRATIGSKFMASWSLPDAKLLNPDLLANVIIRISKNGQIISHRFEKRSGDRVFDQFVIRAIQEANPLPPIPAAMQMSQYSIGLRFRPGSIQ